MGSVEGVVIVGGVNVDFYRVAVGVSLLYILNLTQTRTTCIIIREIELRIRQLYRKESLRTLILHYIFCTSVSQISKIVSIAQSNTTSFI